MEGVLAFACVIVHIKWKRLQKVKHLYLNQQYKTFVMEFIHFSKYCILSTS